LFILVAVYPGGRNNASDRRAAIIAVLLQAATGSIYSRAE
jgi:hypothetical protein